MTGEQADFGARLRRERERRDIELATVAETTKIAQSLLAALERGDASNWPPGIYRRSFLREYAAAIGLPPEPVVAEFLRVFPEAGTATPERIEPQEGGGALRLTLAHAHTASVGTMVMQAAAAALDAGIVASAGLAMRGSGGVFNWTAAAMFGIAYYSLATAWLGRSPMLWIINAATQQYADGPRTRVPARQNSREVLHIVAAAPRQGRSALDRDFNRASEPTADRLPLAR